jgi:thimet oligopeptidase
LAVYQDLLGLTFMEIDDTNAWHEEVRTFDVSNANDGKLIGRFCLDLHPRQGKFTHAAVWNLECGADVSSLTSIQSDRKTPVMAMLCNFGKSGGLTFKEIVTFFHEFGHVMHGLCAKTKLPASSRITDLERDFIECPSKMLEFWCFDEKVLEKLTAHPESGKPLPVEIAKKLEAADNLFAGYTKARLLMLSVFDFLIHSMTKEELSHLDVTSFFNDLRLKMIQLPGVDGEAFPASFGHLVSGYDGVIYGYLLADTFAADLFHTKFKGNPLDPVAGSAYRKAILEPCGSVDPMDLLTRYLGRKPTIDAFLSNLGLTMTQDQQQSMEHTEERKVKPL